MGTSAKAINDNHQRQKKVQASEQKLAGKLNHYHLKTAFEIEAAVVKSFTGTKDDFNYQIIEETQVIKKQIKRGKPGKNTTYQQRSQTTSRLEYQLNQDALNQASLLDGIFPLVHSLLYAPSHLIPPRKLNRRRRLTTPSISM